MAELLLLWHLLYFGEGVISFLLVNHPLVIDLL